MERGFYPVITPIGNILIEAEGDFPARIILPGGESKGKPEITAPTVAVRQMTGALNAYFQGIDPDEAFTVGLLKNLRISAFARAVLREVARIPRGATLSYGEVAARAGRPEASRAVGGVMRANPYPILIPCHRVVKSDGSLGGYGGGERIKIWLLGFEGAPINLVNSR